MEEQSFDKNVTAADQKSGISRRDLLIGAGALGTVLAGGRALAADAPGHRHEDHAPRHDGLLNDVNACLDKGQRCIAHCLVSFREGDTTLAACASKVNEMEAICQAYSYLLAANSTYSKEFAKVCIAACSDCEDECRKHEGDHVECKECADACKKVAAMAKKTFG